jgi:hypothetical protein
VTREGQLHEFREKPWQGQPDSSAPILIPAPRAAQPVQAPLSRQTGAHRRHLQGPPGRHTRKLLHAGLEILVRDLSPHGPAGVMTVMGMTETLE